MWVGTQQQYFELYETAAKGIKAHDPSLKVGGSVIWMGSPLFRPFLAYCRDRKLPLDFVSWHSYPNKPEGLAGDAVTARKVFDEYSFKNIESRLTEWHPMWYKWSGDIDANDMGNLNPQKYAAMREKFDTMRGPKGTSFVASALMLLQDAPLDMANFYTADTNPWGMFDMFGVPGRVYYAFVAFNQLTKTPNRVACEPQGTPQPDITMCRRLVQRSQDGVDSGQQFWPGAARSWRSACEIFRFRSRCRRKRSPLTTRMSSRRSARRRAVRRTLP